jgi:inner membrane protein
MYQTGHQGAALLFAAPFAFTGALVFPPGVLVLGGLLVAGLASAPDLDMRVPLIRHRGITHTV